MLAFWLSLALLLVALVAGIAFVVYRGICLYRAAKRSAAAIGEPVARIEEATREIEDHLAAASAAAARLREAGERLRVSREVLSVQLAAVQDARARMRRMFWFVPGL